MNLEEKSYFLGVDVGSITYRDNLRSNSAIPIRDGQIDLYLITGLNASAAHDTAGKIPNDHGV